MRLITLQMWKDGEPIVVNAEDKELWAARGFSLNAPLGKAPNPIDERVPEPPSESDLRATTVADVRKLAKVRGIADADTKKKTELIQELKELDA